MAGIAAAGTTLPPTPTHMTTLTTDHFYLKYNPSGKVPLTDTLDESLAAYSKVDAFFLGYHNMTTLVIAESNNEYRIITGIGDIPENATACSFNEGPRGIVAIKSPKILPNYRQILTYHMARIMERTIMQDYHSPPEWFQDGLAAYVASDITDEQRTQAATSARNGEWMTLPELETVYANMTVYNENSAETKAARAQAFMLVEYVGESYGNRTLVNILTDFGYCGDINKSFQNRTGQTPETFNDDLRKVLIGPVIIPTPTAQVTIKEYISGYVMDDTGYPLAENQITFTGHEVNTTVKTDDSGYYAAEVAYGLLNVSMNGTGYSYKNTVMVNPGENKVFNITIAGISAKPGSTSMLPAVQLPAMPSIGKYSGLAIVAIALVNILAFIGIIRVLRRNL